MRLINKLIIHCSDSEWGTVQEIDKWHKARGWSGCGYHYVILNGIFDSRGYCFKALDGQICTGRPLQRIGAHCRGHNRDSIGICLIGKKDFTDAQFRSLIALVSELKMVLRVNSVYGHNHFNRHKTCPNFDINRVLTYDF